jgi:hypothetical protein
MTTSPRWPDDLPVSEHWRVLVDGQPVPVVRTARGDFAQWTAEGPCTVEAHAAAPLSDVHLRPRRLGIIPDCAGQRAGFRLAAPQRALLEAAGAPLLHLFAEPAAAAAPPRARIIAAGTTVRQEALALTEGETLWVERGAVLNAHVDAHGAGIVIGGGGLVTGVGLGRRKHVVADGCPGLRIADLTVADPGGWSVVLGACDDVQIDDLRVISPGSGSGTDGLDLVGCSRVRVRRCYIISGDDAIVIKAFRPREGRSTDWARPVAGVTAEDCILGTFGGTCMEIGHELTVPSVEDVTFRDIDVLFAHGFGSPFGIHAGDRAAVRRVRWERVRVEHCYHQVLDLRVMRSRFNHDPERGSIADVSFTDIDWWTTPYNAGYTLGSVAGFDPAHRVDGVRFVRFRRDGVGARSADDLDLLFRHADRVEFSPV